MEAFALLQIEKKKKRLIKEAADEKEKLARIAKMAALGVKEVSKEESDALNLSLGFSIPPENVYAIGRPASAAVWWGCKKDDKTLIGWEIHRYRRDLGVWNYKGFQRIDMEELHGKDQFIVRNLTDNKEYKFSVKSVNPAGVSAESTLSNPIIVEQPLPAGWYRFYNDKKQKFYYANIRCQLSSWVRPELDPYFLEDSIFMLYTKAELQHLRTLYVEEIEHFKCVVVERMVDVFSECGERVALRRLVQLFKEFADNDSKLSKWTEFMNVISHIKKEKCRTSAPSEALISANRRLMGNILGDTKQKFGHWEVVFSTLANRNYYYNTVTKDRQWDLPDEVRFHIPHRLLDKLLLTFDYGHLENFKYQFSMIDIDNSGDISDVEMKLLLKNMNIVIDDSVIHRLIKTIDLNGNGTIEFHEFCYMMYCLRNRHSSMRDPGSNASIWSELDMSSAAKATEDGVLVSKHDGVLNRFSLTPGRKTRSRTRTDSYEDCSVRSPNRNSPSVAKSMFPLFLSSKRASPDIIGDGSGIEDTPMTSKKNLGKALWELSEGHYLASPDVVAKQAQAKIVALQPVVGDSPASSTPLRSHPNTRPTSPSNFQRTDSMQWDTNSPGSPINAQPSSRHHPPISSHLKPSAMMHQTAYDDNSDAASDDGSFSSYDSYTSESYSYSTFTKKSSGNHTNRSGKSNRSNRSGKNSKAGSISALGSGSIVEGDGEEGDLNITMIRSQQGSLAATSPRSARSVGSMHSRSDAGLPNLRGAPIPVIMEQDGDEVTPWTVPNPHSNLSLQQDLEEEEEEQKPLYSSMPNSPTNRLNPASPSRLNQQPAWVLQAQASRATITSENSFHAAENSGIQSPNLLASASTALLSPASKLKAALSWSSRNENVEDGGNGQQVAAITGITGGGAGEDTSYSQNSPPSRISNSYKALTSTLKQSRLSNSFRDLSKSTLGQVGNAVSVFVSKTSALHRAVADASGFGNSRGTVDKYGVHHPPYCFCGCRCL